MRFGTCLVAVIATLLLAPAVSSQEADKGGRGTAAPFERPCDLAKVETISGTVESIERVTPATRGCVGIRLILATPAGRLPVHLGPEWFVQRQERWPQVGGEVEIVGRRTELDDGPALIASEVRMEDGVLVLRDERGRPVWSAWRRAGPPARAERGEPRPLGAGGWQARGRYGRLFDPGTVTSITGVVETVERFVPLKGMTPGVRLLLRSEGETPTVHLGPAWFVENQEVALTAGDGVTIRGSRVPTEAGPIFIATAVSRGEEILTLRDEKGIPVWCGFRACGNESAAAPTGEVAEGCGLYDPETVVTVRGEVTRVERGRTAARGAGIHLHVWVGETTYDVHLGPEWFFEEQGLRFRAGDQVEIRGSRLDLDGSPALIAARLRFDGKVVELRDAEGCPLWGRGRPRHP